MSNCVKVLGMDEVGAMALRYVDSWDKVENPEVISVEKIKIWRRLPVPSDDADDADLSPVVAYKVSGRFEWGLEGEGYNRFRFIVEVESRCVRAFQVLGGFKGVGLLTAPV